MENVFEHDAIPTWSGFIYQGRIAAYLAIKKIIELRDDNKVSEVDKYAIEMEKCEDIAIVYQCEKEKREYISIHQVKNEKENALGAYKKPLIQLMLEKGYYTKDNGDAPDAYLHIANRVRIQNKDFETEYLENIKNWKQKILNYYNAVDEACKNFTYNPHFYEELLKAIDTEPIGIDRIGKYNEELAVIMKEELISSKNCPLCGASYSDREQLNEKIKEETNVLNKISDETTTRIQNIKKKIYEEYLEKVEEKIQIKLENSISDETYADLQNVKKNKAKIFDLEQLLQKIEIEIDNEEKSEESLLPGYNMLITRIKEKLRPVAEEISMQLKEKDFEYYYERFYDKNLELFFEINKEELCEKRKYINGIRHNFYIAEMNKKNKEIEILTSRIDKLEKVVEKLKEYSEALKQGIKEYKKKIISDIEPLLHVYTAKILQQKFNGKSIYISTNEAVDSIQFVNSMKDRQDILYSMSSGQLSAVAISFLLCMNQVYGKHNPCSVLLIDDPVQTIDDVNMVGLVDLLRYEFEDRQIFISTHEQTFEWFLRYRYSKANKAVKIFNMKEIMLNEE